MKKILLTIIMFACMINSGQVWAEWVNVDHVINGNTFVSTSGEVINIIGLSRTPATQMTNFFFEDNDVWIDHRTIDDSGRSFAVVSLHGNISYSQIVDDHKFDKSSDSIICQSSGKKYNCNDCKLHCKSPHPYSIPGARRIRRTARNHRKTWKEFYCSPIESVTISGVGTGAVRHRADHSSSHRGSGRGQNREISKLQSQIKAIDQKIATRGYSHSLNEQRMSIQKQIFDLQLIDAGANPSLVMDRRKDRIEREKMRQEMEEIADSAADSRAQQYISTGQ